MGDRPARRKGVSLRKPARYMELGLYRLWKQGAEGAWFLQVRDVERRHGEPGLASYQTGIYRYSNRKKPSYRAIRFPFVRACSGEVFTQRLRIGKKLVRARVGREKSLIWGRAPFWGGTQGPRTYPSTFYVPPVGPVDLCATLDCRRC